MDQDQYLSNDEINQFLDDLDTNGDGNIEYKELEEKLDQVYKEIAPVAKRHHLHHDSKRDDARHQFLHRIIGSHEQWISRQDLMQRIHEWKIPSLQTEAKNDQDENAYVHRLSFWRRLRAYWSVHGPKILFLAMVISIQLAFGIWQLVKYLTTAEYRNAFGWGAVLAKTCAGALYPTFFFLLLSMSRYLSTFLRKFYYLSRFVNWDLSQSFHIKISIVALFLASLHAIGHLTGSFRYGSSADRQDSVAAVLGPDSAPRSYSAYVATLPGVSGVVCLGLFWILALLSMPAVRRRSYELFQLGHILMFPMIGLLIAHGTAGLLQWPMFGYWLAFPTLLVLVERVVRIALGFHRIPATLRIIDGETVEISTTIPSERIWRYEAGQYIFLQVPKISLFQWHPFTVSVCIGNEMQVHIKTDGDWTGRLRDLADGTTPTQIQIGVNGPFGAPAQRFADFSHSIVVGAGIGVTPFSGILTDLQARDDQLHPEKPHKSDTEPGGEPSQNDKKSEDAVAHDGPKIPDDYRRVDFHWIVRDRNYLLWFSDLLNTVSRSQIRHRAWEDPPHLDIRIQTYVTQRRKKISTHVYRWLLEMHRTDDHPESPLTGLINPTHFGRPDFVDVLDRHYDDMLRVKAAMTSSELDARGRLKVGVFFCGAPVVGEILADRCRLLSARGRQDGSKIEYHFMMEVFG
ncbi:FAD-binding domain-containing protein [Aspergillus ambiguus]|uniref:FAD-binding domain-containing protein n=1 Tax=Aspergillus ambiguus TaxID=176160 RepID=UPI003CCE384E